MMYPLIDDPTQSNHLDIMGVCQSTSYEMGEPAVQHQGGEPLFIIMELVQEFLPYLDESV